MNLNAHGSYSISKTDNIIVVDAQGPFNEVTVGQYLHDIKSNIEDIKHEPWSTLAVFNGSSIFTPDAEHALIDFFHKPIQNNMLAIAIVLKNSHQEDLQQMQLTRIFQACNIAYNFFSNENTAKAWLHSFLEDNQATA